MDRSLIAGYSLVASAFFLAGLLLFGSAGQTVQPAHAELINSRGNLTAMTATTRNGVESLFLLDNSAGRLLIYNIDARNGIELIGNADLEPIFARAGQQP